MDESPDVRRRRKPITYAIVTADLWGNPKICKAGPFGALAFVFALTRNAAHGRTGVFPSSEFEPWYLSRQTGLDANQAAEGRTKALEAQLVAEDGDQIAIVGWSEEWKRADLTAAESERKRLYRLKISTTARTQIPEEKKETRIEEEESRRFGTKRDSPEIVPDKSRTKRGSTLKPDWIPARSEVNIAAETEAKARGIDLRAELLNLRDWAASTGTVGKDWDARWRLWIRRSKSITGSKQLRVVGRVEPSPPEAYDEDPLGTRARMGKETA